MQKEEEKVVFGKKFDGADGNGELKDKWNLLPLRAIKLVVEVLTYGSMKYGDFNWINVKEWKNRYYSACQRHLYSYMEENEYYDKESSKSHLSHAICCLIFMLALEEKEREKKKHE